MPTRVLWIATVAMAFFLSLGPARAQESVTFHIQSLHPNIVDIEFYSQDRNHIWPGNGEVFSLNDDQVIEIPLSCVPQETICYGGWLRGSEDLIWGVGKDNSASCEDCCYVCDGGETPVIVLE